MADNFDVHLPIDGQIVNAPVYNPGPNPIDVVLGTVSQGLRQFQSDNEERVKQNKEKAEAQEKEREEQTRGFMFDSALKIEAEFGQSRAADPFLGLVQGTQPLAMPSAPVTSDSVDPSTAIIEGAIQSGTTTPSRMTELQDSVQTQTDEVMNIETAISQGTMPRSARDAAIDRMLLETRNLFPDVDTEVIVSMMEKMGLKTTMFYDIQQSFKERESIDNSRTATVAAAHSRGIEILGPAAATLSQEQIITSGMEDMRREREMDTIKQNLEIQRTRGELTDKDIERNEKAAARQLQTVTVQSAIDSFAPLITAAQDLTVLMNQNPGSNPAVEEQFMETMGILKTRLPVLIENYASQVFTSTGDPAKADAMRDYLTEYFQNTVITPLENRDKDFNALATRLQTNLGLKVSQAYPFIALLKGMGVDLQLTDTLMEQLSPATRERLGQEIANVITTDIYDLRSRESAQMQVMEIVEVLNGNTTLGQLRLNPEQLQQRFRVIDRTTTALTPRIAQGDTRQGNAWLNGMAEVAVAAQQLNRTSEVRSLGNAILSLTGNGSMAAFDRMMASGEDPERAQAVGLGTRAAVARSMQGLLNKPRDFDNGYQVRYRNGRWEVAFDMSRVPGGQRQSIQNQIRTGQLAPPAEARAMAASLNAASTFLVHTAKWDEGAPKGSERELRAWYNEGRPPEAMLRELERKRTEGGAGDIMEALNSFEEVLQNGDFGIQVPTRAGPGGTEIGADGSVVVRGQKGQQIAIQTAAALREKHGDNVNFRRLESQIQAKGLGPYADVILSQIGLESGFNHRADSGSSYGVMQINARAWDNVAQQRYGKKVRQLSPAQNIDFGLWIWAENLKAAGGNVADAVSMYHSGKDFATVDRDNIGDGNMYTRDYVKGIMAAGGMQ